MPSILHEIDKIAMAALRTGHHDEVVKSGAEKLNKKFPGRFTESQWRVLLQTRLEHDWRYDNKQGGNK